MTLSRHQKQQCRGLCHRYQYKQLVVRKCAGVCECVCWMNFQNIFWKLESIHQRTLIRILYEFLHLRWFFNDIKVYNFADNAQIELIVMSSTLQYHNYFLKLVNVMETFVVHIKNCIPIYYFFMHHMLDIIGLSLEPFSTNLLKIFQLQNCSCYALNLQKQNNLVLIFTSFLKWF